MLSRPNQSKCPNSEWSGLSKSTRADRDRNQQAGHELIRNSQCQEKASVR